MAEPTMEISLGEANLFHAKLVVHHYGVTACYMCGRTLKDTTYYAGNVQPHADACVAKRLEDFLAAHGKLT